MVGDGGHQDLQLVDDSVLLLHPSSIPASIYSHHFYCWLKMIDLRPWYFQVKVGKYVNKFAHSYCNLSNRVTDRAEDLHLSVCLVALVTNCLSDGFYFFRYGRVNRWVGDGSGDGWERTCAK